MIIVVGKIAVTRNLDTSSYLPMKKNLETRCRKKTSDSRGWCGGREICTNMSESANSRVTEEKELYQMHKGKCVRYTMHARGKEREKIHAVSVPERKQSAKIRKGKNIHERERENGGEKKTRKRPTKKQKKREKEKGRTQTGFRGGANPAPRGCFLHVSFYPRCRSGRYAINKKNLHPREKGGSPAQRALAFPSRAQNARVILIS